MSLRAPFERKRKNRLVRVLTIEEDQPVTIFGHRGSRNDEVALRLRTGLDY